jgi:hypothetical protein
MQKQGSKEEVLYFRFKVKRRYNQCWLSGFLCARWHLRHTEPLKLTVSQFNFLKNRKKVQIREQIKESKEGRRTA